MKKQKSIHDEEIKKSDLFYLFLHHEEMKEKQKNKNQKLPKSRR